MLLVGRKPDGYRELAVEPGEIGRDCQARPHPLAHTSLIQHHEVQVTSAL